MSYFLIWATATWVVHSNTPLNYVHMTRSLFSTHIIVPNYVLQKGADCTNLFSNVNAMENSGGDVGPPRPARAAPHAPGCACRWRPPRTAPWRPRSPTLIGPSPRRPAGAEELGLLRRAQHPGPAARHTFAEALRCLKTWLPAPSRPRLPAAGERVLMQHP